MQGVFELPLPAILSRFLPRAQTGWSSLIAEFQTGTYSLPALLIAAKKSLISASQYKKKQPIFDSFLPGPDIVPAPEDWRAMVDGYVSVASTFSQTISLRQAQASPFNLSYMHELHQATRTPCRLRGPFQAKDNASNTCQFAVVLAWMAGQWRLPWLSGQPPPIPTSTPPNRGSFTLLPISLERPTKELIEHFLRPLQPDEGPAFVHPLLAVVKRYDIRQAAAAVTAFLADPEGDDVGEFLFWDQLASHDKAVYLPAVDELNDFIRFLSNVEPDKARRHTLAAVKVRPVVDMHAVNQLLPECRFSYPSPTDAAALVQPGFLRWARSTGTRLSTSSQCTRTTQNTWLLLLTVNATCPSAPSSGALCFLTMSPRLWPRWWSL